MNTFIRLCLLTVIAASISACGSAFFALSFFKRHPCPCVEGYVCVSDGNGEFCVPADALQIGDPCTADEECGVGLTCRDKFDEGECDQFDLDINCEAGAQRQGPEGKACRAICDPSESWSVNCDDGETCYPDIDDENNVGGYCQEGACGADTHCQANALCMGAQINPDLANTDRGSGQCFKACDPFTCDENGCSDCPAEDIDGDGLEDGLSCRWMFEYAEPIERTVCQVAGAQVVGQTCSLAQRCRPGSFCDFVNFDTNGTGLCRKYCRISGGAPACDGQEQCTGVISPGFNLGYCR